MHTKPCIVRFILILALTGTGAELAISATPVPPAVAEHGNIHQWKTLPEDASPWRREPFKSSNLPSRITGHTAKQEPTGLSTDLVLQGIMKSNKSYFAIINGRTVKPGDHIEGWTIADISRYRVTVQRAKEKQIYDIYQGKIDRGTR